MKEHSGFWVGYAISTVVMSVLTGGAALLPALGLGAFIFVLDSAIK